jgi:hypothetical protein
MGHCGYDFGEFYYIAFRNRDMTYRAYPHGRTVSEAVVRLRIIAENPITEPPTVTHIGIFSADFLHASDGHFFKQRIIVIHTVVFGIHNFLGFHNGFCNC